jgi:hypothetical protein
MVGCAGLDVAGSNDLEPLYVEDMDKSCEDGAVRFNEGERPTDRPIVFGLVTKSALRGETGIGKVGRVGTCRVPAEACVRLMVRKPIAFAGVDV